MYERYVDDSQQVAEIENGEEHETVRRLHDIANNIVEDIVMTVDLPENFEDKKLPILDMKVWLGEEDGRIYYQHFEKPTSSKLVISSRSAHSGTCKRSVHINELVRRMSNTSQRLDRACCFGADGVHETDEGGRLQRELSERHPAECDINIQRQTPEIERRHHTLK